MPVPRYHALLNPVLQAVKRLGGSASIAELDEEVTRSLRLSDEDVAVPHDERQTELQYQLAWARTYLKGFGLLTNSERGVWALTQQGKDTNSVDPAAVRRQIWDRSRQRRNKRQDDVHSEVSVDPAVAAASEIAQAQTWRERLGACLYAVAPDAFERLCQRLLRESGFVQVRVTGRSGDGGIDGVGIVRLGGLLGFPILFQCKRYRGSVPSSAVRDFRGAMIGRADRGLMITTGTFSRDAKMEATRDGAPPVDLVDGDQLLDKLKELGLGVKVRQVEEVLIDEPFFRDV